MFNDTSDAEKGKLTPFQRWELASFDPVPATNTAPPPAEKYSAAESSAAAESQLQSIRKQAYDEGYAAGHQAGRISASQQVQAETIQLQLLLRNLQIAISRIDEQLAQSLLDLSLEIAHKMVIETLQFKPEVILKIIASAIGCLPHFNQNAHLVLHPLDAELVRTQMGEDLAHAGWKIFTDARIERGGCRVETAHSNIDATNPARWHNIVESIGQHKPWQTN